MNSKFQILLVLFLVVFANVLYAQTPPPGGGSSVGAPIDAMSGFLIIAGTAFAGRRMLNKGSTKN